MFDRSPCRVTIARDADREDASEDRPQALEVHGYGVFAAEPINKNTRIIDYAGELVATTPAMRARSATSRGLHLGLPGEPDLEPDAAVGGNIARFINHSCTPNCWFEVVAGPSGFGRRGGSAPAKS